MTKINNPRAISIGQFSEEFNANPKNILFWDTCALLDILRFPYRYSNLADFEALEEIKNLIDTDIIYSICSNLTIAEWDEHEGRVQNETNDSLKKTSDFHRISVEVINTIFTTTYPTTKLDDKGFVNELENITSLIISKTSFLNTDEIADAALWRVANKKPPASKKREFKDCAIWETVLAMQNNILPNTSRATFFTVNTDDYMDKGRTPNVIHGNIATELSTLQLSLSLNFQEAYNNIL